MKKILILGVVAVLLSFGLVLASCDNNCPDSGDCEVRTDSSGHAYTDKYCGNGDCSATKLDSKSLFDETRKSQSAKCSC
jgi:hypothetical protein